MHAVDGLVADAERLTGFVREVLGPPVAWRPAPAGLALCIIDGNWPMGVRYRAVENVVDRYRASRRKKAGEPGRDGVSDCFIAGSRNLAHERGIR